jgi:hypothetical protein
VYPTPSAGRDERTLALYRYVGSVVGKALYEGVVLEAQFATFFLRKILGGQLCKRAPTLSHCLPVIMLRLDLTHLFMQSHPQLHFDSLQLRERSALARRRIASAPDVRETIRRRLR